MWKYEFGQIFTNNGDLYIDIHGRALPLRIPQVSDEFLNILSQLIKETIKIKDACIGDTVLLHKSVIDITYKDIFIKIELDSLTFKNKSQTLTLKSIPKKDFKKLADLLKHETTISKDAERIV